MYGIVDSADLIAVVGIGPASGSPDSAFRRTPISNGCSQINEINIDVFARYLIGPVIGTTVIGDKLVITGQNGIIVGLVK